MRKYVIATHGHMASGMKSTLEIIIGPQDDLICIDAYTQECANPVPVFQKILEENKEKEIVFMTDMFGGSVNNNAMAMLSQPNVYVVTGISLATVITILMAGEEENIQDVIENAITQGREMMMCCNQITGEEIEDDEF